MGAVRGESGGVLFDPSGAPRGDGDDVGASGVKDVLALGRRGGVVEMKNNVFGAAERLAATNDEILAALAENLEGDIVGDPVLLDEATAKIEFDLGGGRETDFDLLKADFHEQLEVLDFLLDAHGLGKRLIAVPQVYAAPNRRARERAARPLAVGQGDGWKRAVFSDGRGLHGETEVEKGEVEPTNDRKRADEASSRQRAVMISISRPTRDPPLGGASTIARVRKSKSLSKSRHGCYLSGIGWQAWESRGVPVP